MADAEPINIRFSPNAAAAPPVAEPVASAAEPVSVPIHTPGQTFQPRADMPEPPLAPEPDPPTPMPSPTPPPSPPVAPPPVQPDQSVKVVAHPPETHPYNKHAQKISQHKGPMIVIAALSVGVVALAGLYLTRI